MNRVLITGLNGYIGRYLLLKRPQNITLLGSSRNIKESHTRDVHFFPLSLEKNIHKQLKDVKVDTVIHAAAMANLGQCQLNPALAERVNTEATRELAEWCRHTETRLVYLSTDIVFKGDNPPYKEDDIPQPVNQYGHTKYQAELEINSILDNFSIVRIALALGRGRGPTQNFMDWFEHQLQTGKEITLFKDEIRNPSATPLLAAQIWKIAASAERGIFHLGGRQSIDRYRLGIEICRILKKDTRQLRAISVNSLADYPRPLDVTLTSERSIDGIPVTLPPITQYLVQLLK